MIDLVRKLLTLFSGWSRIELGLLLVMMFFLTLIEMIGIGLFLPLIQAIIAPETFAKFPILGELLTKGARASPERTIIWLSAILFGFFVFKNSVMLLVVWFQNQFIFKKAAEFSTALLRIYMSMPYEYLIGRNSAELTRNIHASTYIVLYSGFLSLLNLIMEGMIVIGVATVLFLVEPVVTIYALLIISLFLGVFYWLIRENLQKWGEEKLRNGSELLKWIRQSMGIVKEAKVLGREQFFIGEYSIPAYRNAQIGTMESTANRAVGATGEVALIGGMVLVVVLSILLAEDKPMEGIVSTLGLFAVAGFRVLPSANKLTSNLVSLQNSRAAIDDIFLDILQWKDRHDLLDEPATIDPLKSSIVLNDISFRYDGAQRDSLTSVSITIRQGQKVALVGPSGAGKSTLADILLGLLEPTTGNMLVDDVDLRGRSRGWQAHIGYVPQSIYLVDDTLRRNIAVGIIDEDIDQAALEEALELSNLKSFVNELEQGVETIIGEDGIRISGGQRQRVGIARAIYHKPSIVVLDEATAALDNETEYEITKSLKALSGKITLVVIAHRLSTIKDADVIMFMNRGKVIDSGTFEQLILSNEEFKNLVEKGEVFSSYPSGDEST